MSKHALARIVYPVRYDSNGTYIWDANDKMIADVRGWGWMQKLKNPEQIQDDIGEFIAQAVNEKLASLHSTNNSLEEK